MHFQHCHTDIARPTVNTKQITAVIYILLCTKLFHLKISTLQQSMSVVSQLEAMTVEQSRSK